MHSRLDGRMAGCKRVQPARAQLGIEMGDSQLRVLSCTEKQPGLGAGLPTSPDPAVCPTVGLRYPYTTSTQGIVRPAVNLAAGS